MYVHGSDPVSEAGVAGQLRSRPEVRVLDAGDVDAASVAVVVCDEIDEPWVTTTKAIQRNGCPRVVLVVTRLDAAGVLLGIEAGACGFLRRAEATPERLVQAVHAAEAGDGNVPPDLLGRLLEQLQNPTASVLTRRGTGQGKLSEREVAVLRLVADGLDTLEIAEQLSYSERTVKHVVHAVTTRLHLRNRSHAVAYAVRQGLI